MALDVHTITTSKPVRASMLARLACKAACAAERASGGAVAKADVETSAAPFGSAIRSTKRCGRGADTVRKAQLVMREGANMNTGRGSRQRPIRAQHGQRHVGSLGYSGACQAKISMVHSVLTACVKPPDHQMPIISHAQRMPCATDSVTNGHAAVPGAACCCRCLHSPGCAARRHGRVCRSHRC